MFTGIIAAIGRIEHVEPLADGGENAGVHLRIDAGGLALDDVGLGDSIAIQGAWLRKRCAAFSMEPQEGAGGCCPRPRKDSEASAMMASV